MREETAPGARPERQTDIAGDSLEHPLLTVDEIEAQDAAVQGRRDQLRQAEAVAESADRQAVISQFVYERGLFGYEPFGNDTHTAITAILEHKETERRQIVPDFDITTDWSDQRILRFLERNYVAEMQDDEAANAKGEVEKDVAAVISGIRAEDPEISNYALCKRIKNNHLQAIPEQHRDRIIAFVQMKDLAANEADAAIIESRINALDFSGEIPNPLDFVQTQLLSTPEQPSGLSEETEAALKEAFGLQPMRDASDLFENIDQVNNYDGRILCPDGQVREFSPDNGIPLGDLTVYPNPTETDRYYAETQVGGRTLRL